MNNKEKINTLKYYKKLLECIKIEYKDYLQPPVKEKQKVKVKVLKR